MYPVRQVRQAVWLEHVLQGDRHFEHVAAD